MEQIRAFIAIKLPDDIKEHLAFVITRLKPGLENAVKWVNPEAIHLTLKFLGNVPSHKIADITEAISGVAGKTGAFDLELNGCGVFPNLKWPRVAWVGLGGNIDAIKLLQQEIDLALRPFGFTPEVREFSPHLTLGRIRDRASQDEKSQLGQAISSIQFENVVIIAVKSINLLQSTLTKNGALYHCLATASLDRNSHR